VSAAALNDVLDGLGALIRSADISDTVSYPNTVKYLAGIVSA